MSKLLHKPLRAFTIYALVILACSIPFYYWVVDYIWLNELDEHNMIVKEQISERFDRVDIKKNELDDFLKSWNTLMPGTAIVPDSNATARKDSVYTIRQQGIHEMDRFRVLSSSFNSGGRTYRLTIQTNVEETDETLLAITIVTICFFTFLVIGVIILNRRIAKGIWRPFQDTLNKLKDFDLAKDKQISFEKTSIEEFEELNNTLDKLIGKNISVYAQQKIFIENASHELQTPLAVLKSKIELLLQNESLTDEQLQSLNAIELPLLRISRINKNLLLLAKIENSQFAGTEEVDLVAAIDDSYKLLADYIQDKTLSFSREIDGEFAVSCNKFLLETLLNNLLTNAIRHTPEHGTIGVRLSGNVLSFLNSGNEKLDQANLFERFSVSSAETTNSGLGLAIVKEICNRYGWTITYSFEDQTHIFSVSLS